MGPVKIRYSHAPRALSYYECNHAASPETGYRYVVSATSAGPS